MKQQAIAKLNSLRMSPRKVRLVVDLIRNKSVEDALVQLQYSKKDAARPVMKLIQSAVANADHNHKMEKNSLHIVTATVDGGAILKRWIPRAMGRATPIRKRTSHITIVLEGDVKEIKKIAKIKEIKSEEKKDNSNKTEKKIITKEKES